jgi:hypothetical protein
VAWSTKLYIWLMEAHVVLTFWRACRKESAELLMQASTQEQLLLCQLSIACMYTP